MKNIVLYPFWNSKEKKLRAFWITIIAFIVATLLQLPHQFFVSPHIDPIIKSVSSPLWIMLTGMLTVFLSTKYLAKLPIKSLGLNFNLKWFKDFAIGVFLAISFVSLIFYIMYSNNWIEIKGSYLKISIDEYSFSTIIILQVIKNFFVATSEELFYRGFLILVLTKAITDKYFTKNQAVLIVIIISSIAFGYGHAGNPNITTFGIINIALLGAIEGVSYWLTGRLGFAIGFHMFWNIFQENVFGMPNSGIRSKASFLKMESIEEFDFWTGGNFGIEGGILSTLVFLVGILALFLIYKKSAKAN